MQITYLGHAGFCVETDSSIIICDPWLSTHGAFDSAWFQYPKNHHMADFVRTLFATSLKDKYIYISHEHKDHFDLPFLKSLKNRDFTLLLADFHRPVVKEVLLKDKYECKQIISLKNEEELQLKDASIRLFIVDAELDCDSAILIKTTTRSFLNLNDCKIHDKLAHIIKKYGSIDIFTAQFSGAIWHPTCYEMSLKEYQKISREKEHVKFELTSRAIKTVKSAIYLPSAGPPCFLDPLLIEKNFEKVNIFPRAAKLIHYLDHRCKGVSTQWPEIMPGDVLDAHTLQFTKLDPRRVDDRDFESYVRAYAKEYTDYFHQRELANKKIDPEQVFMALGQDLENKLKQIKLVNEEIITPLYWQISDYPDQMYMVNFKEKTVTTTQIISDPNNFWRISAPAWQVNKVFTKEIDWPDFALTFRMKLARNPDVYHTLMHGFVVLDADSLDRCCELIKGYHAKKERVIIEYEGKRYSVLRWCPHQGGDLSLGWIEKGCLVCPRHRWQYNLQDHGNCIHSDETIDAICLDDLHPTPNTHSHEKGSKHHKS